MFYNHPNHDTLCLCMHLWVCMHVCQCVCLPQLLFTLFLRQGLSVKLDLTDSLAYLANPVVSASPALVLQVCASIPELFFGSWTSKLRFLSSCGKHFADRVRIILSSQSRDFNCTAWNIFVYVATDVTSIKINTEIILSHLHKSCHTLSGH